MSVSQKDKNALIKQLGRDPRGVIEVTKYAEDCTPLVIKTCPIITEPRTPNYEPRFSPFPTLFYLTHPPTVSAVSVLEDKGFVNKFEEIISNDKKLKEEFNRAQESYINERISLAEDKISKIRENEREVILNTGIGGVKDFGRIKCLHAHYAHYLARKNNPVGRMVERELT